MPIKPKYSGTEWALGALGVDVAGIRHKRSMQDREVAENDRRAALENQEAERERERHQLEIERVKRQQAEEESAKLRADQEAAAAREATRWGIDRVRSEVAAQQKGGGKTDLDPETKSLLDRAGRIADKLSPEAQRTFLTEVKGVAETARIAKAKDQASNRLADTIKDLSSAEFDVAPIVEQLQSAAELLQVAETPAQVAQAVQAVSQATAQARQAVVAEHVKNDQRNAAMTSIQELYAGDPTKTGKASALVRAVQFGALKPEAALEMAVRDKYGLKPDTAADIAAKGGSTEMLYTTPQGRQAASYMVGLARERALKQLSSVVGPDADADVRQKAIEGLMAREWELVKAEHGWFPMAQAGGPAPQAPGKFQAFQGETGPPKGAPKAEPKVPLEAVREAMGTEAPKPQAAQDSPEKTKAAIAAEITKRAKERGWSKEEARAEYQKALKDMGLD